MNRSAVKSDAWLILVTLDINIDTASLCCRINRVRKF